MYAHYKPIKAKLNTLFKSRLFHRQLFDRFPVTNQLAFLLWFLYTFCNTAKLNTLFSDKQTHKQSHRLRVGVRSLVVCLGMARPRPN